MASIIGGAVGGKVFEMAVQQLSKQISLVTNFEQKETGKEWLQHVRDIALRAEDIFELCTVQPLYTSRFLALSTDNPLVFRYKMSRKINEVKDRINSLIEEGGQLKIGYDVLSGEEASRSTFQRGNSKRSSIEAIDSHPVGIEAKVEQLISLLEKAAGCVIAVVGMGGVGKTYLLQHVYNFTKDRFEKSIWLSISQSFYISKLQHDLACHLEYEGNRAPEHLVDVARNIAKECGNLPLAIKATADTGVDSFVNLMELKLVNCDWRSYPEFQNMPNLVSLRLYNGSCREIAEAFGKSGGFPKLRFFVISGFTEIEELPEVEDGAMPRLQFFKLESCIRLRKVPKGLEELKMLIEFSCLSSGTYELMERLKLGGQDWQKVKARNPRVMIITSY
ncbi:hypothetical protein SUGI_0204560 [Cryptomeria japonica]|nr:hypothetical protein SUGI_0204560 [Cryptomeria japonica]